MQKEGDSLGESSAMGSTTSSFSQTCLKIRGLGEDTAGTLDALGTLCTPSGRGEVRTPEQKVERETEGPSDRHDAQSQAVELSNGQVEAVELCNQHSGTAESTTTTPDSTEAGVAGVDRSESKTGGETSIQRTEAMSSSPPPSLWSLEFAYSGLEKVLEALESAVSGLVFLAGAAPNQDAQSETSVLWCVVCLIALPAIEDM